MTLRELIQKVRRYVRDTTGTIFQEHDIIDFINEGINRLKRIPELKGMKMLTVNQEKVIILPREYHYLISLYASSRCYAQDERHYQATTSMNEFEIKMEELIADISEGKVIIRDAQGNQILDENEMDYVRDVYHKGSRASMWE